MMVQIPNNLSMTECLDLSAPQMFAGRCARYKQNI